MSATRYGGAALTLVGLPPNRKAATPEDPVRQEQARLGGQDRVAQAGQVMQLAEHPRERGLAAMIRPGHHEDPFRVLEMEIVADDRGRPGDELVRRRQIE